MASGVPISTTYPMETGALAQNLPELDQRAKEATRNEQIPRLGERISHWDGLKTFIVVN